MQRIRLRNYTDKAEFDKANRFGLGNPNDAFAQYFDGQSYLNGMITTLWDKS